MNKKASLILMSGSPLSGKSTVTKQIRKFFGGDCVVVSTDEIRRELTGDYINHTREFDVWAIIVKRTLKALKRGKVVVLDATLRQKDLRMRHLKYYKNYPIYYIAFEKIPFEVILERNEERTWKQIDKTILKKLWEEYEIPTEEEMTLYKKSTMINNDNSEKKISELLDYIQKERS
jgi:predicted kinase